MIMNGKKEAKVLRDEIKEEIKILKQKTNKAPSLSVILIGNYAPGKFMPKTR